MTSSASATLVWIRFLRFPPLLAAYEQRLARQRYCTKQKFARPRGDDPPAWRPPAGAPAAALTAPAPTIRSRSRRCRSRSGGSESAIAARMARPGRPGSAGSRSTATSAARSRELAFARGARIEPHANPNTTWFIVIEGGGWVGVGDEHTRVAAGEAVLWPADVPHAAWTEHSEMRAFVVEFADADDAAMKGIIEGRARELTAGTVAKADGALRDDPARPMPHDPDAGEPA